MIYGDTPREYRESALQTGTPYSTAEIRILQDCAAMSLMSAIDEVLLNAILAFSHIQWMVLVGVRVPCVVYRGPAPPPSVMDSS